MSTSPKLNSGAGDTANLPGETANPLRTLNDYGQSVWLDYIRRSLISSGELKRLIDDDGLRGVTSNPAIFEKAITGSTDYSVALEALRKNKTLAAKDMFESLAVQDIQDAAGVLSSVYKSTARRDGYVSLEVSPDLAHDTTRTVEEARRLWKTVSRDNVMIKVPATPEGIPAIEQLISEGININVTLLFSLEAYERVAQAYIAGLTALAKQGGDLRRVASVASFFVSRIDTLVDGLIAEKLKAGVSDGDRALLTSLLGKVAIANAKLAYQRYQAIFGSPAWEALAAQGAQTQRLLWASTGTKNPQYRDVLYVEELVGPDTVDTIPPATLDAFRDHGRVRASLEEDAAGAARTMESLQRAGISMKDVTARLVDEGVKLFADAFVKLLFAVDQRSVAAIPPVVSRQTFSLPGDLNSQVQALLEEWQAKGNVRRLWERDASLWTGTDENNWLGWLGVTEDERAHSDHLKNVAADARKSGFTHALLLGMGGSSLCPDVIQRTFGKAEGFPQLLVLDSTDPAQIRTIESKIDLARTLFIVSSKSGSTLEPNIFKQYFFERAKQAVGAADASKHFIAITDPGSKLQQTAEADRFRNIFFGLPSIGGRYSALSDFGMVPAAIAGVDAARFLDRTDEMVHACATTVDAKENPGVLLGTVLGVLGRNGRDKVTIIASPAISSLGGWLEQLLAESTGKEGKGLVPVDGEEIGPAEVYGQDRLFAYLRLESAPDAKQDSAVAALEKAGQPVARINVAQVYDLGQEFFRWEIATAVAGSILGINAFNQPDVEASKLATKKLTTEYEQSGALPPETAIYVEDGMQLFTDPRNTAALDQASGEKKSVVSYLRAHLNRLTPGDYFAALAYVEMNDLHTSLLQSLRHLVRDKKHVATCVGFGPRFLHSTGQAYKGGPNTGVFLQITCQDALDLPVPGQKYTFGVVKAAQARGDFEVLIERQRRALRVHLGADVKTGLEKLVAAVREALL